MSFWSSCVDDVICYLFILVSECVLCLRVRNQSERWRAPVVRRQLPLVCYLSPLLARWCYCSSPSLVETWGKEEKNISRHDDDCRLGRYSRWRRVWDFAQKIDRSISLVFSQQTIERKSLLLFRIDSSKETIFFFILHMELATIQSLISTALEQFQSDQLLPFVRWLDEKLAKYRMSNLSKRMNIGWCNTSLLILLVSMPTQSIITPKHNAGTRFVCSCGRSFTTEITIRETANLESSSPPATPMIGTKLDLKTSPPVKRSKTSSGNIEPTISIIRTNNHPVTLNHLVERNHPSNDLNNWSHTHFKQYENSPGKDSELNLLISIEMPLELFNNGSTRAESDIEGSSDESHCLEEFDNVLSDDKTSHGTANFIYSNALWNTSLSSSPPNCLSYSINSTDQQEQQQSQSQSEQMITLKPINHEPLSPVQALLGDEQTNKTVVPIHRQPILIAFTRSDLCSNTGPTHFKCTQCHETFDTLMMGQEHVNNGLCISDSSSNVCEIGIATSSTNFIAFL